MSNTWAGGHSNGFWSTFNKVSWLNLTKYGGRRWSLFRAKEKTYLKRR